MFQEYNISDDEVVVLMVVLIVLSLMFFVGYLSNKWVNKEHVEIDYKKQIKPVINAKEAAVQPYNLFLDDVRDPSQCAGYVYRFGYRGDKYLSDKNWRIVRTYNQFRGIITIKGLPKLISFDHDLADEHYNNDDDTPQYEKYKEKTGYDCAKWLITYCYEHKLALPEIQVHSMNPVGRKNIITLLENYKKHEQK